MWETRRYALDRRSKLSPQKSPPGGTAGLVWGGTTWGELLAGPRDLTRQVTHLGQSGEHEAFAAIPENLQRIAGSIRVVSDQQMHAATECLKLRSPERAGDRNWVKWERRRHPGVPCNETFRTDPVWRGEGRVIRIANWQAPPPATNGRILIVTALVVGAMGNLVTWQSREP